MSTKSPLQIIPVLSSANIERDLKWYEQHVGFKHVFGDNMYAGIQRDQHEIHLQWHHAEEEDPVLPSMIKLFVEDIEPYFNEFLKRGTIAEEKLRRNTPWGTHEFGFYDLNQNAIFIVQDTELKQVKKIFNTQKVFYLKPFSILHSYPLSPFSCS